MRYLILSVVAVLCGGITFGQKNNPYSQRGTEFVESFNLVKRDYDAGNIKALNEKTLAYYSGKIPLKNSITIETAATVFKTIQSGKTNLSGVVKASAVSETAKKIILDITRNPKGMTDPQFQDFLLKKNEEIASAKVSVNEREMLYTLSAISYQVRNAGKEGVRGLDSRESGCLVQDDTGSTPMNNGWCITAAATVGFMIGNTACGFFCGLGGAVIAGVATAIALS